MWRQMGINYVRYSQIAASATRKCLKKGVKKEAEKPVAATVKITSWQDGKPAKKEMSTAVNKTLAIIGGAEFDEETWLVEPPNLPTQSKSTQESGRIAEWLQGAAMNVDFQTRSALSRKLANQAAKKKKRAEKLREKAKSVIEYSGENLDELEEEIMEGKYNNDNEDLKEENETRMSKCNENVVLDDGQKLNKQYSEIFHEQQQQHQQQHGISDTLISTSGIENITVKSNDNNENNNNNNNTNNNNNDDDDDDDENDDFYDASSDFNEILLSSTNTVAVIDAANITSSKTIASSNSDSRESKVITNGTTSSALGIVNECIEPFAESTMNDVALLNSRQYETPRQFRQINTARVQPMVAQNILQRSSLDKSRKSYGATKSHSLSTQPDLKDIKSIVERQEAELREELSKLKANVQCDIANKTPISNARKSQMQSARRGTTPMVSSKSTEFYGNGAKLSAVNVPSPTCHVSRLPTPVRKNLGRSLIPTPRAYMLAKSAVRGLAGGSTPSLVISSQHVCDDTRSECGSVSRNDQNWTDECF